MEDGGDLVAAVEEGLVVGGVPLVRGRGGGAVRVGGGGEVGSGGGWMMESGGVEGKEMKLGSGEEGESSWS